MADVLKKLIELTALKEEKVLEIMDKTIMQKDALKEDNINKLIELTDSKQEIIDDINLIDEEFEEKYQPMVQNKDLYDSKEIAILKEKINSILNIMQKINDLELENKKHLGKQMEAVRQNIKLVNMEKKGMNAYFQRGMQGSNYIDQKK